MAPCGPCHTPCGDWELAQLPFSCKLSFPGLSYRKWLGRSCHTRGKICKGSELWGRWLYLWIWKMRIKSRKTIKRLRGSPDVTYSQSVPIQHAMGAYHIFVKGMSVTSPYSEVPRGQGPLFSVMSHRPLKRVWKKHQHMLTEGPPGTGCSDRWDNLSSIKFLLIFMCYKLIVCGHFWWRKLIPNPVVCGVILSFCVHTESGQRFRDWIYYSGLTFQSINPVRSSGLVWGSSLVSLAKLFFLQRQNFEWKAWVKSENVWKSGDSDPGRRVKTCSKEANRSWGWGAARTEGTEPGNGTVLPPLGTEL